MMDIDKKLDPLKDVRNNMSHQGTLEISDEDFDEMWKEVADILISFGLSKKELNEAKIMALQESEVPKRECDTNEENTQKARTVKDQGNEEYKRGKYSAAIDLYSNALHLPNIPIDDLAILYSNKSIAYLKANDFDNAKEDGKVAVRLRSLWWKGYYRLAKAYLSLKKYDKAVKKFELAHGLEISISEVKNGLDHCKAKLEMFHREDHLDSHYLATTFDDFARNLENQKKFFKLGLDIGICGEAHRFRLGNGVPQDYEKAAQLYAKAAANGNAEGI
jgi:tetratricopeptide (TPR) repeat protein